MTKNGARNPNFEKVQGFWANFQKFWKFRKFSKFLKMCSFWGILRGNWLWLETASCAQSGRFRWMAGLVLAKISKNGQKWRKIGKVDFSSFLVIFGNFGQNEAGHPTKSAGSFELGNFRISGFRHFWRFPEFSGGQKWAKNEGLGLRHGHFLAHFWAKNGP